MNDEKAYTEKVIEYVQKYANNDVVEKESKIIIGNSK